MHDPGMPGAQGRQAGGAMPGCMESSEGMDPPLCSRPEPGTAFALGWLIAQVYGLPAQGQETELDPPDCLPGVAELAQVERVSLNFVQLQSLARPFGDCGIEGAHESYLAQPEGLKEQLRQVHSQILNTLSPDAQQLSAYQLGRALSDTSATRTTGADSAVFLQQFERHQLARLRSWMTQAGRALPPHSAEVAARSLQNWQDWADINAAQLTVETNWANNKTRIADALENQGRAWRALLTSPPGSGLPGVNAWVQAGESVLRTSKNLARRVLLQFWPVAVLILAVTGGLLYLAITYAHGVAKYWTSLVTLVAAVGVSGVSLRAAGQSVGKAIEQQVWDAATLVARAWEVTWLPALSPTLRQRYRLFRRGVAPPQIKKGLEMAVAPKDKAPTVAMPPS